MLTLLFEDRLKVDETKFVGISYLLQMVYSKSENITVEFAESNVRLLSKALDLVSLGNEVIAFLDCVVDNKNSISLLDSYIKAIMNMDMRSMVLLPIPCIEYYFVKAYNNLALRVDNIERMLALQGTSTFVFPDNKKLKSFEKACKAIVKYDMPEDICKTSFVIGQRSFYNSYYGIPKEEKSYERKCIIFQNQLPAGTCKEAFSCSVLDVYDELYAQIKRHADLYKKSLGGLKLQCADFGYLNTLEKYSKFLHKGISSECKRVKSQTAIDAIKQLSIEEE